jgi:predicted nucleotidyltransferase
MLDITSQQLGLVQRLLARRLPRVTALAFGSRVAGWPYGRGSKPYSDLDIALWGLSPDDDEALAHLRADLEESALPWRVDLSDALDFPVTLRQLVEHHGVVLKTGLAQPQAATS